MEPSDAIAWVVPSLPSGNLPLLCTYQGTTAKVGSCAISALTLQLLLKITKLRVYLSRDSYKDINNIDDIMDVVEELT